jgi:FMN reductase
MSRIVTIAGSPSAPSRTLALTAHVGARLSQQGFAIDSISVRDLDAADLLHARIDAPGIRAALGAVESADAVVVATPVYKASYAGILKAFLDLLPQLGLTGKVVLPLATGGTIAHVLAIDYALRPVLASLGALHITTGLFLLDKTLTVTEGGLVIDPDVDKRLDAVVDELASSVRRLRLADA